MTRLMDLLAGYERIGVAFSGGIDSTFLAVMAAENCPGKVILFIGDTCFQASADTVFARHMAQILADAYPRLDYQVIPVNMLDDRTIVVNSDVRCYFCKKKLFSAIQASGRSMGIKGFIHGANSDDMKLFRPGQQAAEELGFESPLARTGFTKAMIRREAKKIGIP